MNAEILSTGDEIRSGHTLDTNSAYLAKKLEENGIFVTRHHCVGDTVPEIESILQEISERADICIVTGGLGATQDDLTAEAAANAFGVAFFKNEETYREVTRFFHERNLEMSWLDEKEAMFPEGAQVLTNTVGVAPGFYIVYRKCHFFFMPGVPTEMKKMFENEVLSVLKTLGYVHPNRYHVTTYCCFGLSESSAQEKLNDFSTHFPTIQIGYQVSLPIVKIKLYSADEKEMREVVPKARTWVLDRIGEFIYSDMDERLEETLARYLKKKQTTLSVAESCTGGLISHLLTNIPNISEYFTLGVVSYSNEAKMNILGVEEETIRTYGAVSKEVVQEMAKGVRQKGHSEYAIATTGIAGPAGGSAEKPVGTVWISIATPQETTVTQKIYSFNDRRMHKAFFAGAALFSLIRKLSA